MAQPEVIRYNPRWRAELNRLVRQTGMSPAQVLDHALLDYAQAHPAPDPLIAELVAELKAAPRPGRAGRPRRFYADWACLAVEYGTRYEHDPTERLAEDAGLTTAQVAHLLQKARQHGLYRPHGQGKVGGILTDLGASLCWRDPRVNTHLP